MQAAALFAIAGVAFAVGNLFLARSLPDHDYARFTLFTAVVVLASHMAPAGLDQILLRHRMAINLDFTIRLFTIATLIGTVLTVATQWIYGLTVWQAVLLFIAVLGAALIWVVGCAIRGRGRRIAALMTDTCFDWMVLGLGLLELSSLGSRAAPRFSSCSRPAWRRPAWALGASRCWHFAAPSPLCRGARLCRCWVSSQRASRCSRQSASSFR